MSPSLTRRLHAQNDHFRQNPTGRNRPMNENYKVVLAGSPGVGKTSLVERLALNKFSDCTQSTVGVEFRLHEIDVAGRSIKLNIWDTAGLEKYRSVAKSYFRNSVAAVLVFAINQRSSFLDLESWLSDIQSLAVPNSVIILVGNKWDLEDSREVSSSEAQSYADKHGLDYIEASALDGRMVDETFVRLATKISERVAGGEISATASMRAVPPVAVGSSAGPPKQGVGCC